MTKPALTTLNRIRPMSAQTAVPNATVAVKAISTARMADDNRMGIPPG
jgi:hypothetical protein